MSQNGRSEIDFIGVNSITSLKATRPTSRCFAIVIDWDPATSTFNGQPAIYVWIPGDTTAGNDFSIVQLDDSSAGRYRQIF